MASFLAPHDAAPTLRRAALLLARVRQDGGANADLEALEEGMARLCRSVAENRLIGRKDIDRVTGALARVYPTLASPGAETVYDLVLQNALTATREVLGRLHRSQRTPTRTPAAKRPSFSA